MKNEFGIVHDVQETCFVLKVKGPGETTEMVKCHFSSRYHFDHGVSQPQFSEVRNRSTKKGDIKEKMEVVFRRHDRDPFRASRWELKEAYDEAEKKREASWNRGAKQTVMPFV